jgi:hypothetical protein
MAEINKLSVEKALDKLRAGDAKQSKDTLFNSKIDALDEEIKLCERSDCVSNGTNAGVIKTIIKTFIRYASEV